jgi:hypothetical protein
MAIDPVLARRLLRRECGQPDPIENTMDNFSPEFAQHWLAGRSTATEGATMERRSDESLSPSQQEALAALADRVSAARSVF